MQNPTVPNEDVVYEVVLKLGQELTQPVIPLDINGKTVYGVGTGEELEVRFIVCLAPGITAEDTEEMVKYNPGRIIFADECFENIEQMSNVRLICQNKRIVVKVL